MPERRGDWILTYATGTEFYPLDPRPEEVHVEDIAHALAHVNRYTGHTRYPYSVAQHAVYVAWRVPGPDKLWALLHDAAEAYISDLARPLKYLPEFAGFGDAEAGIMKAVCERFGLDYARPDSVTRADRAMLYHEARLLLQPHGRAMHPCWEKWRDDAIAAPPIARWEPDYARQQFLDSFALYTRKDAA